MRLLDTLTICQDVSPQPHNELRLAICGLTMRYLHLSTLFPRLVALLAVIFLVSCASLSSVADTSSIPGAQSNTSMANLPRLNGDATVVITVNDRPITIQVNGAAAPITAGNFVDLVNRGVYDGTVFHRVVREPQPFVVQGGDPQSTDPTVSPQLYGTGSFIDPKTNRPRYIPLEILGKGSSTPTYSQAGKVSPQLNHTRGAVAMARSQLPDSASAQFYIALQQLDFLDGNYAVFGYVTEGMDVVDSIQMGDRIQSAKVVAGLEHLQQP
jgi:peptidyl-prolyl cis-trans isomerase B (cyclophilin B)